MQPLERTILRELFADAKFAEKVAPYLKEEYFYSEESALIYKLYSAFYEKYRKVPQFSVIRIGLDNLPSIRDTQASEAVKALAEVQTETALNADQKDWLYEETEEFCQDRAVYCALQQAIRVMDDPKATKHIIPDLMKDALAVSFDTHVGHDFFEDADARFDFYHKPESRVPFDLQVLNDMTKGGVPKKTLNIAMAGTNVGKSLFLCHVAAAHLRMGKNVLYITLEMAEERIAERIDANLMNIPLDDLEGLTREQYVHKIKHLKATSKGRLIIKEYPTGAGSCAHFRALLQELRLKSNFVPDSIFVDYITICSSARVKMGNAVNSYTLYKFVAEELRGLAVEFNVPVFSAAQFNRTGFNSSDPELSDVGESWAIPQTADFMFALVQTEELEKIGQVALQPMKNRYQKKKSYQQEFLGMDTNRMLLYDLSPAQAAAAQASMPPAGSTNSGSGNSSGSGKQPFRKGRRPLAALKTDAEGDDD